MTTPGLGCTAVQLFVAEARQPGALRKELEHARRVLADDIPQSVDKKSNERIEERASTKGEAPLKPARLPTWSSSKRKRDECDDEAPQLDHVGDSAAAVARPSTPLGVVLSLE